MRFVVAFYTAVFVTSALWAWDDYITHINSVSEHLLPGIVFFISTAPLSLLLETCARMNPLLLSDGFSMLFALTGLGICQVLFLLGITKLLKNHSNGS